MKLVDVKHLPHKLVDVKHLPHLSLLMFFSSIALKKRDGKHFLVYLKAKEKLFDIDQCVLERFLKVIEI